MKSELLPKNITGISESMRKSIGTWARFTSHANEVGVLDSDAVTFAFRRWPAFPGSVFAIKSPLQLS